MCFQKMESMKRLVMNPLTTENQQQNANINYRKQFVSITTKGYNEFFLKYLIHFDNKTNKYLQIIHVLSCEVCFVINICAFPALVFSYSCIKSSHKSLESHKYPYGHG